jgi:hypothetical protein
VKPVFATLWDGLRTVILRAPRGAALDSGPGVFFALVVLYFTVSPFLEITDATQPWSFDGNSLLTLLADALLTLAATYLLTVLAQRREIVWGAASILLWANIVVMLLASWPLRHFLHAHAAAENPNRELLTAIIVLCSWRFLIVLVFAHWLLRKRFAVTLAATLLAYALTVGAWWWLPGSNPLASALMFQFASDDNDSDTNTDVDTDTDANADTDSTVPSADDGQSDTSTSSTNEDSSIDAEETMFKQPALLDAALAKLKPRTPGKINLYAIAFAGDGTENVFRNEAEYTEKLLSQRFDAQGHIITLINHPATLDTQPLATWTNLHYALNGIAKKMDPQEDILFLYLSTHGSKDHQLLVDLDPLPLDQIEPDDLSDALKTEPRIRWKVLIVNACYSGGFINALRDDSTMVLTSARKDRSSFGCGVDSDITYFGKAFLSEALNKTTSLREAFDLAVRSITNWENANHEKHSEPQIASTPNIEAKLATWQRSLAPAPAVPFAPARSEP